MPYYVTTPIYYPNGNLSIGATYTTVAADVIKRFQMLKGNETFFVTGTDEHGQKIQESAKKANMHPLDFTTKIVNDTLPLWKSLNISYDKFVRTTDPEHERVVQEIFQKLYDQGDIYKDEYEGLYCVSCEAFFTETQAKDHICPDCKREVVYRKEESYFFRLSKYQDRLLEWYKTNPIYPKHAVDEMINFFMSDGLQDLSVTRSSFDWGVKVPFDPKHVIYVWIDALASYLTGIGYGTDEELFKKFYPADIHLMGKEILRFHAIIWPALLMALGLELPKKVFAHGWILFDNDKMSKSKGNVYYPEPIIKNLGSDVLRYFILREFSFGQDGNFSIEKLVQRYNSDLANDLGNLVSRTLAMIEKYFGGELPEISKITDLDREVLKNIEDLDELFNSNMEEFKFHVAIEEVFVLIRRLNRYIDETKAWELIKDDVERLKSVLRILSEGIVKSVKLLGVIMPETKDKVLHKFSLSENENLETGAKVAKGDNIFTRVDNNMVDILKKENKELFESRQKALGKSDESNDKDKSEETDKLPEISIDDFDKLDLRIGEVVEINDHEKADRLYVLKVDLGSEVRTIVSGLKNYYKKEELLGKKVVVIANLKPVKLRGVLSSGMVLAAGDDKDLSVLSVLKDIKNGTKIS